MTTLPGLETFLVLVKEGSFSGAARNLRVPRSTVSRRIQRLEEALGERLLERTTRHVSLTDAGRMLHERGRPLVAQLRALAADIAQIGGEPAGLLRIAAPPGLGREFIAQFLIAFRERYPRVSLEVVVSHEVTHLLGDDFDIVLREGPAPKDCPWVARSLGSADRLAVASPSYLETHGTPQDLDELAHHDTIALVDEHSRGDQWPLLRGDTVRVLPKMHFNDLDVVRQAALAGLGVAMLPVTVLVSDLQMGRLVPVLPEQLGAPAEMLALLSHQQRDSPKIGAFFDTVALLNARMQP